VDQILIPDWVL